MKQRNKNKAAKLDTGLIIDRWYPAVKQDYNTTKSIDSLLRMQRAPKIVIDKAKDK